MASETRRAAKALIERRVERFESRHALDESKARLQAALATSSLKGRVVFTPSWGTDGGKAVLDAEFAPPPRTQCFLKAMSLAMSLLVAASLWAAVAPQSGATLAYLLPLVTGFAILALPFVFVALGSNREAEEARIRKVIRVALLDEEEKRPQQQRRNDAD